MKNNGTITDLKVIYDRDNKTFVEAYALIDGETVFLDDDKKIRKVFANLKEQHGAKSLKEIKSYYSLVDTTNERMVNLYREKYADYRNEEVISPDEYVSTLSLKRENPYDNQEVKESEFSPIKKAAIAAGIVLVTSAIVAGCHFFNKSRAKEQVVEEPAIETLVEEKEEVEKIDPKTWEDYTENYVESEQKTLLTGEMDLITSNIVDIEINDKEYKLALSPEELTAFNYYYNTFNMENDELVRTYGMYNMDHENSEDLINNVHDALDKVRFSLVKAEKIEDVLKLNFVDEEAQKLYDKYAEYMVEYNTASKKSKVKAEIEESLRADFIENGSINLKDHPAATVVLQLIPSTFNLQLSPLDDDLNVILVGTEVNINVDGVKDSVQNNGLVDDACSVIDRRLEKADEYREQLQLRKESNESYNEMLLLTVNSSDELGQEYYDANYKVSELDTLTENTYDITGTMIPLMNEYLVENYEIDASIDYEELNEELKESLIAELQAKQLNNTAKWDLKTNPSGGKVGDVLKGETVKGVKVDESQLTDEQIKDAKDKYIEDHPDIVDGTDEEEIEEKEDEIKEDVAALCVEAYEAGQAETIKSGESAPINSKWANHEIANVRNAYYNGRSNGIKVYNEQKAGKGEIVEEPTDDYGDHEDNPNQNDDEIVTDPPVVDEPVEDEPTDDYGDHEDNPNQNSGSVETNIDTTDVIEGTITTDDSNVDDMSEYGEVQSFSITPAMIDAMVEEMANPESPINNVEENTESLTK